MLIDVMMKEILGRLKKDVIILTFHNPDHTTAGVKTSHSTGL